MTIRRNLLSLESIMSVKTIALAVIASAFMLPVMAQQSPVDASSLKRAEVLADLDLWREAGMQNVAAGAELGDDATHTAEYSKYLSLRNSPRFAQAVQSHLGNNTALAGQAGASTAAE